MLKFLGIVAGILGALIAAVLIYAATKPDTFRVARATTIDAPPEKIFPLINDLRRWDAWSPWEKKDPEMKRTFGDNMTGKGAWYAWEGDHNVGKGRMEITGSSPPSNVTIALDFERPFEAHNTVDFTLQPQGNGTQVNWDMRGPLPYMAKVVHVIFDMDSMVGKDFEAGLASLKSLAEK